MLCYLLGIQVKQKGSERMREDILSELKHERKQSRNVLTEEARVKMLNDQDESALRVWPARLQHH